MTPTVPQGKPTQVELEPSEPKQPYANKAQHPAVRTVPLKSILLSTYAGSLVMNPPKSLPGDAVRGRIVGWQPVISHGKNRRCEGCGKKRKRCRCAAPASQ